MVYDHQTNRGENAIIQLVMSVWLQIGAKQYQGKMILLPRLFRGYWGNFPAAPVESAPMFLSVAYTTLNKLFAVFLYYMIIIDTRLLTTACLK